jgi:hypothetical protein
MGTSDEENGVAPGEEGILGLLVLFNAVEFAAKEVRNEPAKNRLLSEEFGVIERTSPEKPLNEGADHKLDLMFHTATDEPGDVKCPPTHSWLFDVSQKSEDIGPLGPLDPRVVNAPEEGVYEATLLADVLAIEEKDPAK